MKQNLQNPQQNKQPKQISNQTTSHSKIKKDRIFILVMVILIASLSFELMNTLQKFSSVQNKAHVIILTFADIIAIIGAFWLVRSYRRTLRLLKKQQQDKENKEKIN